MRYVPNDGFPYYFDLAGNMALETLFSSLLTFTFLDSIDEKKAAYRYAPDKWSIKQIVGHITDHERIKIFRAFLLSRNESVELWGYDQNSLVENSRFEEMTFQLLKTDLQNVIVCHNHRKMWGRPNMYPRKQRPPGRRTIHQK